MAKFTVHTAVHGEQGTEFFAPGDDVPQWAVGKVGAHVTDGGEAETKASDSADNDESDSVSTSPAPDFTAPKPARARRK